jgi:CRP/FNR family cyclic AMP-dependent transcriptional regulator
MYQARRGVARVNGAATRAPRRVKSTMVVMGSEKSGRMVVLKKVPVFTNLSESELAFLAERARPRAYSTGETVFTEGEPCQGLFVVESGAVKIFKLSAAGREQVLTFERAGSSVAELPVFDGGDYPASAVAAEDSKLLFLSKEDFHRLCVAHPEVALKILRVIGSRLRLLVNIIEELSFTTVRQRLAALLARMAERGQRGPEGIEFTLPAGQQELAAQIGTVRELVSRNLSRFQAEGILKLEGRKVCILDPESLRAEVERAE